MMSQNRSTHARKNSAQPHVVLINDYLLTKILIRLPILCIHLFTTVSKQWLRIITSPIFTLNRSKILNLDHPAGLFVNHRRSLFECDFVSLDSRLDSRKSTMDNSFGSVEEVDHVRILQSCNGLLLCAGWAWPVFYYVHNSSTNLFKRLPQPYYSHDDSRFYRSVVLRMVIDPRKSFDYKVVQAERTSCDIEIQIYSSETRNWSLWKFIESRGCLLLVCGDDIGEVTIYKMMKGCFVWSVRYLVNTEELMNPLPEGWSIRSTVWSIGLGEREDDAFLVIKLFGKVVKYNLISNTINEIFDIGSNQMDDDDVEFIQPISVDPNIYEFIPSFASV
ncbi:hypothetical protein Tco_0609578 [Tanacetum coccineum]